MMIEADVALGKLKGEPHSANRPIMAHPPVSTSDLTLEDFLDMVLEEFQYKGIKLDIKSSDILEQALQLTKNREYKIRVPLWLNADIVQGPGGSISEPLNADMFLRLTKLYFPTAVISVGWKTKFRKGSSYTFDHVRNMRDVLRAAQITTPVTFPIRAALSTSLESRENILWLLNEVPGSTVTIWSPFGDEVDVPALVDFIDAIGKEFVGLALPNLALQNIQIGIVLDDRHIVNWTNWEISRRGRFHGNVHVHDVRDVLLAIEY